MFWRPRSLLRLFRSLYRVTVFGRGLQRFCVIFLQIHQGQTCIPRDIEDNSSDDASFGFWIIFDASNISRMLCHVRGIYQHDVPRAAKECSRAPASTLCGEIIQPPFYSRVAIKDLHSILLKSYRGIGLPSKLSKDALGTTLKPE